MPLPATQARGALGLLAVLLLAAAVRGAPENVRIELGWEVFQLEVAADLETRTRGLMGRQEIAAGGGMVFVFPDTVKRSFWMKNCLVDMDLAYLDDKGVVVSVHTMTVEPARSSGESASAYEARLRRYQSEVPSRYAIELRAGTLARLGIEPGARLTLPSLPQPR